MLSLRIDLGAEAVQVAAVDAEGAPAAEATAPYPTLSPQPGWAEQNPFDWWDAAVKAIQAVIKTLGPARSKEIKVVNLTGPQGAVFLDEAFQPIRPAILGRDQRAVHEAEQVAQWTGALVSPGSTAAQILWLRLHEPEQYGRIQLVVQPKDYVRFRMTGIFASDLADAPSTLLVEGAGQDWSQARLEALAVPVTWLPRLKAGTEQTGQIIPGIWALTGIPTWTPVTAGLA